MYVVPLHPLIVWLAAFLLGIALGIAIAAFIPGWSKPRRLVEIRARRGDDETTTMQAVNIEYYLRALTGDRFALDVLGSRAGRINLTAIHGSVTDRLTNKRARDHAWLLYDNAAPKFSEVPVSTLGQELHDNA